MAVRLVRPEQVRELEALAEELPDLRPRRERPTRPLPHVRPSGATPFDALLKFHAEIRRALDLLDDLARAPDYGDREREVAYTLWEFFQGPLAWHDADEDLSLFARLRAAETSTLFRALLDETLRNHVELKHKLAALKPHLENLMRGQPCASAFVGAAFELRQLLEPHLALEEHEIYPFARYYFSNDEVEQIGNEIRERMERRGESATRAQDG